MSTLAPRVPGNPILGSLLDFRRDRIGMLTRIPEIYGDVAKVRVGFFFSALVVSSPTLAHATLVEENDAFVKGLGLSVFARPLLGNGLLSSEGEFHKRQRRMIAPAFMHKRIADYADTIASYSDRFVTRLGSESKEGGRERGIDLSEEMMKLTFEIVGKTLFDADVSGDAKDVGEALTAAMQCMFEQINSVFPLPPNIPSPTNLRGRKIIKRLDEVVYRLIAERRANLMDHGDFLSMLLLTEDEDGTRMNDQQVRDEAMTILLAGHETTANALAWTFYLLAKHPDVRARLEQEADRVLQGRVPTMADLPSLPYALQVFKESMRLYPPAYMVVRRARRDVKIGPHALKKGEAVVVDIIGMHRRKEFFREPLAFHPDRFAKENEKLIPKHAYMPFGGGPRICIGNHFALMEGQIILAHLAQHLRFDLVEPKRVIEADPLITLRPKGGVGVLVEKRARRQARYVPRA